MLVRQLLVCQKYFNNNLDKTWIEIVQEIINDGYKITDDMQKYLERKIKNR